MKIEQSRLHEALSRKVASTDAGKMISLLELPHECSVPNCPGNTNRLKLELFDEMLAALEETSNSVLVALSMGHGQFRGEERVQEDIKTLNERGERLEALIAKAKELK